MHEETKYLLIDQLRFCQSTIESTLFNTKVASKARINKETLIAFQTSIATQEETLENLDEIIKTLQENPNPDLETLSVNIDQMVKTTLAQEKDVQGFIRLLFNQG